MKKKAAENITENEVMETVVENAAKDSVVIKELEGVSIDDYIRCSTDGTLGSYSREMVEHVKAHTDSITSALKDISKNYEVVIFNLYWVYRTKSYKALGCDSIFDYALSWFDFRKSSVYKFIDIAERFGNEEYTAFDARYKDYSVSKLSLISDKSDSEIDSMLITPYMSVSKIKRAVKNFDAASGSVSSCTSDNDKPDSEPKQHKKNKSDSQEAFNIDNNEVSLLEAASADTGVSENCTFVPDTSNTSSWSPDALPYTSGNRFYDSYECFISNCGCTSYTYKFLTNFIFNHYDPCKEIPLLRHQHVLYEDITYFVQFAQNIFTFSSMYCSDFYVTLRCANEYYTYANFNASAYAYTGRKKLETDLSSRDFLINSILTDLLTLLDFKCDKITFKIQNNENPKEGGKDI